MKAQCAAVFFYQQPWQLDSFSVAGWRRVDDAFFIHHQRLSGYSLLSELAADVVT